MIVGKSKFEITQLKDNCIICKNKMYKIHKNGENCYYGYIKKILLSTIIFNQDGIICIKKSSGANWIEFKQFD